MCSCVVCVCVCVCVWERERERERERRGRAPASFRFKLLLCLSPPPLSASFTGSRTADGEAHSAAGLTAGRTLTPRTPTPSHLSPPSTPPSLHSPWAQTAAATTARTACSWTRSRAPGRETLPAPRTAAGLTTWSTAAMIPTASSPMSTGTCGGWGKGGGASGRKCFCFLLVCLVLFCVVLSPIWNS